VGSHLRTSAASKLVGRRTRRCPSQDGRLPVDVPAWRESADEPEARGPQRQACGRDDRPAQRTASGSLPQPTPVALDCVQQPASPLELPGPQPDACQDGGDGGQDGQQPQGAAGQHDRQPSDEHTAAVAAVQPRPVPQTCAPAAVRIAGICTDAGCGRHHGRAAECAAPARRTTCTSHRLMSRLRPLAGRRRAGCRVGDTRTSRRARSGGLQVSVRRLAHGRHGEAIPARRALRPIRVSGVVAAPVAARLLAGHRHVGFAAAGCCAAAQPGWRTSRTPRRCTGRQSPR
jgi:hypothetical protein